MFQEVERISDKMIAEAPIRPVVAIEVVQLKMGLDAKCQRALCERFHINKALLVRKIVSSMPTSRFRTYVLRKVLYVSVQTSFQRIWTNPNICKVKLFCRFDRRNRLL